MALFTIDLYFVLYFPKWCEGVSEMSVVVRVV